LIELQKVWGIGLFLQGQQLITGMGSSWEFASSISARRFALLKRKAASTDTAGKLAYASAAFG